MKILNSFLILAMTLHGMSSLKAQTPELGIVTDVDGNIYRTILIGNYLWLAENLKATSYNNGSKIPNITDSIVWTSLTTGAFCWYLNDEVNAKAWGALYNWYAVNTGRLCPDGWLVPTDKEWKNLEGNADTRFGRGDSTWDMQGGRGQDAGIRLKTTSGWSAGGSGTDNIGFSALPGGERCSKGRFFVANRSGFWWSSSGYSESFAWYRNIIYSLDDEKQQYCYHSRWFSNRRKVP